MNRIVLIIFLLNVVFYSNSYGQNSIIINDNRAELTVIEDKLHFFLDTNKNYSIGKILGSGRNLSFQSYDEGSIQPGYTQYWMRLTIVNATKKSIEYYIGSSKFDTLEYFITKDKKILSHHYTGLNVHSSLIPEKLGFGMYVELNASPNDTLTVYARGVYEDRSSQFFQYISTDFSLVSKSAFTDTKNSRIGYIYAFIGIFIIMFLYNFSLFFLTKDKSYLLYSIFSLTLVAFNVCFSGYIAEFLSFNKYYEFLTEVSGAFLMSSLIALVIKLFEDSTPLKQYKKHLVNLVLCFIISIFFDFFFDGYILLGANVLLYVLSVSLILLILVRNFSTNIPSRFFILGYFANSLGTLLAISQTATTALYLGVQPFYFTSTGHFFELLLFSLSISSKINIATSNLAKSNEILKVKTEELFDSEKKLRLIYESSNDLFIQFNRLGTILQYNPSVENFFLKNKLPFPRSIIGFLFEDEVTFENFCSDIRGNTNTQREIQATLTNLLGDQIFYFLINCNLLKDLGEDEIYQLTIFDITQLKNTEKELIIAKEYAQNSLELRKQFFSNMSHEIRTPMNGIVGMIELLQITKLTNEQTKYVDTIKESSYTLLNILNSILDFAKIEAGKMQLYPIPVSLSKVLEKVILLFNSTAEKKSLKITCKIDDKLPQFIRIDENRFIQILSNLLSNAIKFTDSGFIEVSVLVKDQVEEEQYIIECSVKDTGIGIPPDQLINLFKAFSQIENAHSKSYAGTGLGLLISRDLVSLMGGTLKVQSSLNQGSNFYFQITVPRVSSEEYFASVSNTKNSFKFESALAHHPTILVVDDNRINLDVASGILRKSGANVEVAISGTTALKMVDEHYFDLIYMDIQMPDIDGIKTMKLIKEQMIDCPPIIAVSAFSSDEDKKIFLEEGFDDYFPKPLNAQHFIEKTLEWLPNTMKVNDNNTLNPNLETYVEVLSDIDEVKLINYDKILALRKFMSQEELLIYFEELIEDLENQMSEFSIDLENEREKEIRECMHTIYGSLGTLGIDRMCFTAKRIGELAKDHKFAEIKVDRDLLFRDFEILKTNYKNFLS